MRWIWVVVLSVAGCVGAPVLPKGHSPLRVRFSRPAEPARSVSGTAWVTELIVENDDRVPVRLEAMEVVAPVSAESRQGQALCAVTSPVMETDFDRSEDLLATARQLAPLLPKDSCVVSQGIRATVGVWARGLPEGARRMTIRLSGSRTTDERAWAQELEVPLSHQSLPALGPPVRGWVQLRNGLGPETPHRLLPIRMRGKLYFAQRHAVDMLVMKPGPNQRACPVRPEVVAPQNADYWGYGAEVLAVADGRVARVVDGIGENQPGATRVQAITVRTVTGNAVWLELAPNRYAFYAHVQPGSIRVREGQWVKKGQVLALLGNSGNSTAPHLHFHVAEGLGGLDTEGIPFEFERFDYVRTTGGSTDGCVPLPPALDSAANALPENEMLIRFESGPP